VDANPLPYGTLKFIICKLIFENQRERVERAREGRKERGGSES
jgi:hypothetical protein